jgi:uncharacterized membrane protein
MITFQFLALVVEILLYGMPHIPFNHPVNRPESLLGVFFLMYIVSVYVLTRKKDSRNVRLLATVTAMFVLCTAVSRIRSR